MDSSGQTTVLAVGLMSGTSADGVDAALIRTDGANQIEFIAARTVPYEPEFRRRLIAAARRNIPLDEVVELERELTDLHAAVTNELLSKSSHIPGDVSVIGFHGHTLRHKPVQGITWQIGDASRLAALTKIAVVADFRRRDMAAGGQGAPLAPLYHAALFASADTPVAILNLGGVGNLTWLAADGSVHAGDTGPGCGLLDAWMQSSCGLDYDRDGEVALNGQIDDATVQRALASRFFSQPFPKSADRYDFDQIDVSHLSPADGAATLCGITAGAVLLAIKQFRHPLPQLWVTGGGSRHPLIMQLLQEGCGQVLPVEAAGLRSDSMEAECFAWLAVRRVRGLLTSLPTTTGCREATCGGVLTR